MALTTATRTCGVSSAAATQRRPRCVQCFASAGPKPLALVQRLQQASAATLAAGVLLAAPAAIAADGVAFTAPGNGAALSSPVHVAMSVAGMEVRPAAEGVIPGSGHFHVYVDVPKAQQQAEGEAIPFDDAHKHFGKGQTEADLELAPGKHTLTLQFADALHQSYGPKWASAITVNVK